MSHSSSRVGVVGRLLRDGSEDGVLGYFIRRRKYWGVQWVMAGSVIGGGSCKYGEETNSPTRRLGER